MASRRRPLVVVTRKLPDKVEVRMCELFDTRLHVDDVPMSQADLVAAVKTAEILVPTVTDRIDSALLSQAGEQLRLIANFGNGVDHIDVATALQRGITVTNTPGVLTEDTADMTMSLILAVPRRLAEGSQVLTGDRDWTGWSPTWMLGHRIWGKRLGIVGIGRIGQAGAGLDVSAHEPAVSPKLVKLAKTGKVVLLPHLGSATIEGRVDMGEKVIINIKTFMDGHRPPDRVLPSML